MPHIIFRWIFVLAFILAGCGEFAQYDPVKVSSIRWSDGDSGEIDGERFRLADVDAPETGRPECDVEREQGRKAKRFVQDLTRSGTIEIVRDYGADRYNRRVVELSVDGEDLSDLMIEAGYLKPWPHSGVRALSAKPDWCGR